MLDSFGTYDLLSDSGPSIAATFLLFQNVDAGIFSRVTMTSMTGAWYKSISPFEAILVGLVILEIVIMRYLLILPLDFSKWIEKGVLIGTAVSKRKRRNAFEIDELKKEQHLLETMLTVVRRLDREDCFLQSLCELKWYQSAGHVLPRQISKTLWTLKNLDLQRTNISKFKNATLPGNESVLTLLGEAVVLGEGAWSDHKNTTIGCELRYQACPLKEGEVIEYLSSYFNILNFL